MREVLEVAFRSSQQGLRGASGRAADAATYVRVEFRRRAVEDHLYGGRSMLALSREYQLPRDLLARSKKRHLTQELMPETTDETARELREADERIAELEAARGGKTMEVDFLQRSFKQAGLPFAKAPRT
jgi:transposase-like protein